MGTEREEDALGEAPATAADEMQDATDRLRDKAWMIAPMTSGVLDGGVDLTDAQPEAELLG